MEVEYVSLEQIDDLIDSGGTLKVFDRIFGLKSNAVAVLLCGPNARPRPNFCSRTQPDKSIVFTWEETDANRS
ncbi:MAG TPA: hypothetical protein VGP72_27560 [Planctomycetota bacterium]